jgi:hypothetical protein
MKGVPRLLDGRQAGREALEREVLLVVEGQRPKDETRRRGLVNAVYLDLAESLAIRRSQRERGIEGDLGQMRGESAARRRA